MGSEKSGYLTAFTDASLCAGKCSGSIVAVNNDSGEIEAIHLVRYTDDFTNINLVELNTAITALKVLPKHSLSTLVMDNINAIVALLTLSGSDIFTPEEAKKIKKRLPKKQKKSLEKGLKHHPSLTIEYGKQCVPEISLAHMFASTARNLSRRGQIGFKPETTDPSPHIGHLKRQAWQTLESLTTTPG